MEMIFWRKLIQKIRSEGPSDPTPTIRSQGPGRLPIELVDEILSYVCNIDTLRSCSLTCRPWYATVKPLLCDFIKDDIFSGECYQILEELSKHDLLRLVKRFRIVSPRSSDHDNLTTLNILINLSSFKNLRELRMDDFRIPKFMEAQETSIQLIPNLQSLVLVRPAASCLQILQFIGFFGNLQDFGLINYSRIEEDSITDTLELSLPPLRGWLALKWGHVGALVDLMITLRPRLHLTGVDLSTADPYMSQRIIDACVETLETCQFGEGEDFFEIGWEGPTDVQDS